MGEHVTVRAIMKPSPVMATPDTPTLEAIAVMRRAGVGCLPVVKDDHRLVGIVTADDFLYVPAEPFEAHLASSLDASRDSSARTNAELRQERDGNL